MLLLHPRPHRHEGRERPSRPREPRPAGVPHHGRGPARSQGQNSTPGRSAPGPTRRYDVAPLPGRSGRPPRRRPPRSGGPAPTRRPPPRPGHRRPSPGCSKMPRSGPRQFRRQAPGPPGPRGRSRASIVAPYRCPPQIRSGASRSQREGFDNESHRKSHSPLFVPMPIILRFPSRLPSFRPTMPLFSPLRHAGPPAKTPLTRPSQPSDRRIAPSPATSHESRLSGSASRGKIVPSGSTSDRQDLR